MVHITLTHKLSIMRFIKISILFGSLLIIAGACETENLLDQNIKTEPIDSSTVAFVKFIQNFAGNTPQLPTAPNATTGPQVFLYANGAKLTGTAVGFGGIYPATTVYATVPASANINFYVVQARMNLAVVPNVPAPIAGDTLITFSQTLEAGKFYSFIMGDTVPTRKVTVVEDQLPTPAYQKYKIRMANWLMNMGDTINVYSRREGREIIQNISHKQISDWVELPIPVTSDTFDLRKKGTTAVYLSVPGVAPAGMRMYTIYSRGKTALTGKVPAASIVTNR